jgi:hypothetical protein
MATEQADVFEDGKSADHRISLSAIGSRVKTGNASAALYQASSCVVRHNPASRAAALQLKTNILKQRNSLQKKKSRQIGKRLANQ